MRPPAVYGPGDRATLPIMRVARAAACSLAPRGRSARFSLLTWPILPRCWCGWPTPTCLRARCWSRTTAGPGGYGWARPWPVGRRAGSGVRCASLGVPRPAMALAALVAERRAGADGRARCCRGRRSAELFHPDWVCDRGERRAPGPAGGRRSTSRAACRRPSPGTARPVGCDRPCAGRTRWERDCRERR